MTEDGTNAAHGVNQTITAASNVAYTASVYVKPNGRTWVRLFVDDSGGTNLLNAYFNCTGTGTVGTVANGGTGSGAAGSIQALANGWYRCVLTGTPSSANTGSIRFLLRITTADNTSSHAGNSTSGAYFWGAQVEAASNVSSYIPTTTGSQARSVDLISLASTAFSSWFNATEGTFFAQFVQANAGGGNLGRILSISDGTTSERFELYYNGGNYSWDTVDGGAAQASLTVAAGSFNTLKKAAARYKLNDFHECVNGTLATADTAGTLPTVTTMYLGNSAANTRAGNVYIQRVGYFQTIQDNAFLQSVTA